MIGRAPPPLLPLLLLLGAARPATGGDCPPGRCSTDLTCIFFCTCNNCAAGRFCPGTQAFCSDKRRDCPAGKYSGPGDGGCEACSAGRYAGTSRSTTCTGCSAGRYAGGAAAACIDCAAGWAAGALSGHCFECSAGRYSTAQSAACTACGAGRYSGARSGTCHDCSAGQYSGASSGSCIDCAAGRFSGARSGACTECGAGRYAGARSGSCTDCAAGRAAGTGAATCGICGAGQYAAAAAAACTACPGGQFAANAAASQCSACEPGQYSSAVQVGRAEPEPELRRCMSDTDCQYDGCAGAGWEEAHCSGSSDDDSRDCAVDACPCLHKDEAVPGFVPCPGYEAHASKGALSARVSQLCSIGGMALAALHHEDDVRLTCLAVLPLLALAGATETSAALLVVGSELWFDSLSAVEQARGAVRCEVCPAGHFASAPAAFCSECTTGASTASRTGCEECIAGRFIGANRECQDCAAGQYQGTSGQSACLLCGAGSATDALADAGATTCTACARGQYTESSTLACRDCAVFAAATRAGYAHCTATCADPTFAANPADAVPYDCAGHVNDLVWAPTEVVCSGTGCTSDECCVSVPAAVARLHFDEAMAGSDVYRSEMWTVSATLPCPIHISHLRLSSARAQFEADLKGELTDALGDGSTIGSDYIGIDDIQASAAVSDSVDVSWHVLVPEEVVDTAISLMMSLKHSGSPPVSVTVGSSTVQPSLAQMTRPTAKPPAPVVAPADEDEGGGGMVFVVLGWIVVIAGCCWCWRRRKRDRVSFHHRPAPAPSKRPVSAIRVRPASPVVTAEPAAPSAPPAVVFAEPAPEPAVAVEPSAPPAFAPKSEPGGGGGAGKLEPTVSAPPPPNWQPQGPENCALFPVRRGTPEFNAVRDNMAKTMPDADNQIVKVERIQNRMLWDYYCMRRRRMTKLARGKELAEESVWHGTSKHDPATIFRDEQDGFMMQHCVKGMWGRGLYFAENASYSDRYSHELGDTDERCFLLAKLLVGDSVHIMPNDSSLAMCPDKPDGGRYDTVTGETRGSKVFVIYENGRAYPEYLVTYYR